MKKLIALTTAAALSAGMLLTASAGSDDERYLEPPATPYFYMKAVDNDEYETLRDGALYIDRSKLTEKKTYRIDMEAFIKDESLMARVFLLKLKGMSDELKLVNVELTETKYGTAPYFDYRNEPQSGSVWCHIDENMLGAGFSSTSPDSKPWVPAGEKSDDYPICLFTMELSEDAPSGCYTIGYPRANEENNLVTITLVGPFRNMYYVAEISKKYYVHVSGKMLGDINDDGKITKDDAAYILNRVGLNSNNTLLNDTDLMTCDVNGDEVIDDEDAELVMDYCLEYNGREPDMSLNEFIKSR